MRFQTELFDYLEEYDELVNWDIRPKRAGMYLIYAQVCFNDVAGGYLVGIRLIDALGVVWITSEKAAIAGYQSYISLIGAGQLAPGDIYHIEAYQNSGGGINLLAGGDATHIGAYRVF